MTKFTEMSATARRQVARNHRVEANVVKIELDATIGFTAHSVTLKAKLAFHTAQAKLWEAAAAHAEEIGQIRLA